VVDTNDGVAVERRDDPRASFAGYEITTPWDALQVGYFISYACWNYLTAPFLFTYPGVETRELEPWQEDGETWRRLHVTFPRSIATHSTEQVFYYGADFMQRRMDYAVEVNGDVLVAQYQARIPRRDGRVITEIAIDSDEPPHQRTVTPAAEANLASARTSPSDTERGRCNRRRGSSPTNAKVHQLRERACR
jgi:hypothetical protein